AVQTSLGKADSAVQSVGLASGTNNGTVKLTVGGAAADNIAVKGLGSAAYTASTAYATAAQGTKADSAVQPATLNNYVLKTGSWWLDKSIVPYTGGLPGSWTSTYDRGSNGA
ncbi:MAG: hypothetical protein LBB08_01995, partial [Rickettsiales bacterium]|nr:hypothetical protein [Rickettsiales bacterium]